jgi:hypothetical protein
MTPAAGRRPIAQVISLVEEHHVLARDIRLLCGQSGEHRRERLGDVDRHVARLAAWPLLRIGEAERKDNASNCRSSQKFSGFR